MRPMSDPLVHAGMLFQPLRGMVFALVFIRSGSGSLAAGTAGC
jgi:hypothetical protein